VPRAIATFTAGAVDVVLGARQVRMHSLAAPVQHQSQSVVLPAACAALFMLRNRRAAPSGRRAGGPSPSRPGSAR
jgi:hypothetical protein